jgi:hypothetical protein
MHSRKRKRSYRGGYTYKHTGQNDEGEDVSNSVLSNSRRRRRSSRSSNDSSNDKGRGTRNKRSRKY